MKNDSSIGYRSDGRILLSKKILETHIQPYEKEDIIGVGILNSSNKLFLTLNGQLQYWSCNVLDPLEYFATIGLNFINDHVRVNFGLQKFMFDIEMFVKKERIEMVKMIQEEQVEPYEMHQVVQNYLSFNGYFVTLSGFFIL